MGAYKVTDDIYAVGVLNPGMRIFDVVMRTEFGTTYNSYIVRGTQKTALIETCHARYFERYVENISAVCDLETIDYIVLNHCEPDHSGSLGRLLEICPKATILVSQAGSLYLKNIANRTDLPISIAKDGNTIDLGGKTLRFISAPFLHWPDSMFTWCAEEKALFTCDFFGAHYCEPYVFDSHITYPASYESALKEYFDAIFGPFLSHVRNGLAKVEALDAAMFLTSHGPVLTKECKLPYVLEQYKKWSAPKEKSRKQIPIFYCTAYGNTKKLAEAIAAGMAEVLPGADIGIFDLNDHDMSGMAARLNDADAFCIGSPTINADAVPPAWILLSHVDAINSRKKPAFVFGSYGWSGEAVPNLMARLAGLKMNTFSEGLKAQFVPSEEELARAKSAGIEFAQTLL